MKYKRFEELPVWQDAIELAVKIFELTSQPEFKYQFLRALQTIRDLRSEI